MNFRNDIRRAAELIRAGQLVVFPTETVYGLGANALDAEAVAKIYRIKGRPASSPLIVHVSSVEMAKQLVLDWPEAAGVLASRWWPGPLTMVLPKQPHVPDNVTAGLPTVGIRMPDHPVALELIRQAGVPLAAPSANRFTRLSPTEAGHVREALGSEDVFILDGGPARVGIESTVVSLAEKPPLLLRPGMVSREEIEAVAGPLAERHGTSGAHASPGLHARHYSPRTPLLLVAPGGALPAGRGAHLFRTAAGDASLTIGMPGDVEGYAAVLYATLHRLDREGLDWIAVETPPEAPGWEAVTDRLRRAAHGWQTAGGTQAEPARAARRKAARGRKSFPG